MNTLEEYREYLRQKTSVQPESGDKVLTPFMGIGSEVFQAIKMNRFGVGFELKRAYFDVAVKNVTAAINGQNQMSIFDIQNNIAEQAHA